MFLQQKVSFTNVEAYIQCIVEVHGKSTKTYKANVMDIKMSDRLDVSYHKEISAEVMSDAKVVLKVVLGVLPKRNNIFTLKRNKAVFEEYISMTTIQMDKFNGKRPGSVSITYQLQGKYPLKLSAQCYTSKIE